MIISLIILTVIMSTFYEHFFVVKHNEASQSMKVFISFSLKQSWKTLTASTNPKFAELKFLHGVRTLMTLIVMSVHCGILLAVVPTSNPIAIEKVSITGFNR